METVNVEEHGRRIPVVVDKAGDRRGRGLLAGGSLAEAIGGGGAMVVAILGLIGLQPVMLCCIAVILVGSALTLGGGTLAARYARLLSRTVSDPSETITGGLAFESVCGVAGIALGVLALLGVGTFTLLGVSCIVLGVGLALASGARGRLVDLLQRLGLEPGTYATQEALSVGSGAEMLVGLAAIVLGIIALATSVPVLMTLVAMLCMGSAILLSGSSLASRISTVVR